MHILAAKGQLNKRVFKGDLDVDLKWEMEGYSNGDFKQDMEGDLLSVLVQVTVKI